MTAQPFADGLELSWALPWAVMAICLIPQHGLTGLIGGAGVHRTHTIAAKIGAGFTNRFLGGLHGGATNFGNSW